MVVTENITYLLYSAGSWFLSPTRRRALHHLADCKRAGWMWLAGSSGFGSSTWRKIGAFRGKQNEHEKQQTKSEKKPTDFVPLDNGGGDDDYCSKNNTVPASAGVVLIAVSHMHPGASASAEHSIDAWCVRTCCETGVRRGHLIFLPMRILAWMLAFPTLSTKTHPVLKFSFHYLCRIRSPAGQTRPGNGPARHCGFLQRFLRPVSDDGPHFQAGGRRLRG